MSGATSVLDVLGALATGGSVRLGPITFTGFEVPARINFGGSQQLVLHKLPGGARVIDSLGDDPATPQWKGSFTGPLAAARARQVNALRVAAEPVPLSFGPFTAQVVIRRFTASYERNGFWIPYAIVCEVVPPGPDDTGAGGAVLAQVIGSDGADALAAIAQAGTQLASVATVAAVQASTAMARLTPPGNAAAVALGGLTTALTTGLGIVAGVPDLSQSPGAATQAAAQLQSASDGIARAVAAVGAGLAQIGATAAAAGTGDPVASINDLVNATALAGTVASLVQADGFAARAANNAVNATILPGSAA